MNGRGCFFACFFLFFGFLNDNKDPKKIKNEPQKQVWRGDALQSKRCRRPPRVWPGLALIIWWGLWFQVITFMWRVRRTKWVFKGKSCQVLVFLIIGTFGRTDHTNTLVAVTFCWVEPLNFIESSVQWLLYWHHNYGPSLWRCSKSNWLHTLQTGFIDHWWIVKNQNVI